MKWIQPRGSRFVHLFHGQRVGRFDRGACGTLFWLRSWLPVRPTEPVTPVCPACAASTKEAADDQASPPQ